MTGAVRPYRPDDREAVVAVFHRTVALGRPLPFRLAGAHEYAELSLGWFLDAELDRAAVWEVDGIVGGYALAATELDGLARAQRRAGLRLARTVARRAVSGRLDRSSRRFWTARARDTTALARRAGREPAAMVGHLNLLPAHRGGAAGRRLVDHLDRECRLAGGDCWFGEINAPVGRRAGVIRRYGMEIVGREPNHTLTMLAGRPVERLVVRRTLGHVRPFAVGGPTRSTSFSA